MPSTKQLLAIRDSHIDACKILEDAQKQTLKCKPVWDKLYHAQMYLDKRAKDELACILTDSEIDKQVSAV